jgi:predicted transcriptional regulator
VSAKVPEPLFKRLREIAKALRTEEGRLVERAVAELVERLEKELKLASEAGATSKAVQK